MMRALTALLLLLAGCDNFPRDTQDTSTRVAQSGMRVGWNAGAQGNAELTALVRRLEQETGKPAQVQAGTADTLLLKLEAGELDLVVGAFDAKSPWIKRVTFSKPLATSAAGKGEAILAAAMRNGEHAWAMSVDRAVAAQVGS